jgi:hypothetical protein
VHTRCVIDVAHTDALLSSISFASVCYFNLRFDFSYKWILPVLKYSLSQVRYHTRSASFMTLFVFSLSHSLMPCSLPHQPTFNFLSLQPGAAFRGNKAFLDCLCSCINTVANSVLCSMYSLIPIFARLSLSFAHVLLPSATNIFQLIPQNLYPHLSACYFLRSCPAPQFF